MVGIRATVEETVDRDRAGLAVAGGVRQYHIECRGVLQHPRSRPAHLHEKAFAGASGIEMRIDQRQRAVKAAHRLRIRRRERRVDPGEKDLSGALKTRQVGVDERDFSRVRGHEIMVLVGAVVLDHGYRARRRQARTGYSPQ